MGTVAVGQTESVRCPLDGTITVTPTIKARVAIVSVVPNFSTSVISAAKTFDVSAGDVVNITAIDGAVTYTATTSIETPDGGVVALSEAVSVVTLTATGTAFTGACEFRGITVRAISGTPQTVTVYDATSATGTAIATFTVSAVGTYYWDGDWTTAGNGTGGRRVNSTGCHVVISGGTSRTIDVMVE